MIWRPSCEGHHCNMRKNFWTDGRPTIKSMLNLNLDEIWEKQINVISIEVQNDPCGFRLQGYIFQSAKYWRPNCFKLHSHVPAMPSPDVQKQCLAMQLPCKDVLESRYRGKPLNISKQPPRRSKKSNLWGKSSGMICSSERFWFFDLFFLGLCPFRSKLQSKLPNQENQRMSKKNEKTIPSRNLLASLYPQDFVVGWLSLRCLVFGVQSFSLQSFGIDNPK